MTPLLIYVFLTIFKKREITKSTINTKNITLAIEAAPAAIPPKPKTAAINAIMRNMIVHRNIIVNLYSY